MGTDHDRSGDSGPLPHLLAFLLRSAKSMADIVTPIDGGVLIRTPSMPKIWDLNHVRLAGPIQFDEVLLLAERHLGDLAFRHFVIEHEPTIERLAEPLRLDGWRLERDLLMVLRRSPNPLVDPSAVVEIDVERSNELMARWHLDERPQASAEELQELAALGRREALALGERHFGIALEDGWIGATARLRVRNGIGQVEGVYTRVQARGRGWARALLCHAVSEALASGCELVFIVADADDWPKELYRQVGFEPAGWFGVFHRDL